MQREMRSIYMTGHEQTGFHQVEETSYVEFHLPVCRKIP